MNRINLLIIIILGIVSRGICQPQFTGTPNFPSSVGLFDRFEVSFTLNNTYSNPYDPDSISIMAIFFSPDSKTDTIDAFYYEGYSFYYDNNGYENYYPTNNNGWRIRFTPNCLGTWRFILYARDRNGMTHIPNTGIKSYTFVCNAVSNADGFISKANSRFLKRDVVRNGQRQFQSYFPIGPNIAWYGCKTTASGDQVFSEPFGIFEYKLRIDSLYGNANFMRIFLNRYQYLSLYGPEYTQIVNGSPVIYFDSTINQKDSAELDYIIEYAAQHGIAVTPCIFSYGDFMRENSLENDDPSVWGNNPFRFVTENQDPGRFFSNTEARRITINLLRYIVSRWGYATNIMCWELWNEVSNMFNECEEEIEVVQQNVLSWHNEMKSYIRGFDPYKRCITTSLGNPNSYMSLYSSLFDSLDFVQMHNYENIHKAASSQQQTYKLLEKTTEAHFIYPNKPFFMEEFGFGQGSAYLSKDPWGIDLHNSLWSSLFSTSIGPSCFWWWYYLNSCKLHKRFKPILTFCSQLPVLSETFTAHHTGTTNGFKLLFPNDIQTYYMINAAEDTIYGWSQDTAFAYQSLRWLTDSVESSIDSLYYMHFIDTAVFDPNGYVYTLDLAKRPGPSSNSNVITIPIHNQSIGTEYKLVWYNTETGLHYFDDQTTYTAVSLNNQGAKELVLHFPSAIRNIKSNIINNTFGDVVFVLTKSYDGPWSKKKNMKK